MSKELLFSVTQKDCKWEFKRGSGAGGQNRNKVETAVVCIHEPSGASGQAEDERTQMQNRRLAFKRMAQTPAFKAWLRVEASRRMGTLKDIEKEVDEQMTKIKVEVKDENGRWVGDTGE